MRQVGQAELLYLVRQALGRVSPGWRRDYASTHNETKRNGDHFVALAVMDVLAEYEMLASNVLPENMDLFSRAAYGLAAQPMIDSK